MNAMPELLKPSSSTPQSHAQTLREDANRLLSRSPHPYHRQNFELPYPAERFPSVSPLRSLQTTDDEGHDSSKSWSERYRGSGNSDSGTEADDEHFLKGLPAPKPRLHKGLRGLDGTLSGTPSPLLSPTVLDDKRPGVLRSGSSALSVSDADLRRAAERIRMKRRAEIVRRLTEAGILAFVGGLLSLDPSIRKLIWAWRKELACQSLVIASLIVLYPLRLLRHLSSRRPWRRTFPLAIPPVFDPAPLFYPPAITILVSLLISVNNPRNLLPSIILSIAALPRQLIPAIGGLDAANTLHWFISCIPFWIPQGRFSGGHLLFNNDFRGWNEEILVLLFPLHQALCTTLRYLTTTSLLSAELQLLSIALILLLLLSSSPQMVILKSLLWGGGIGVLVSCENVLRWGVALARVPKWRFKRPERSTVFVKPIHEMNTPLAMLSKKVFTWDNINSSDEERAANALANLPLTPFPPPLMRPTTHVEKGSTSAVESQGSEKFRAMNGTNLDGIQRRHTLPVLSSLPRKSSQRTPGGRRKRAASSSVQAFFSLTQKEATVRKWVYAAYVYLCVIFIILFGIRGYVQVFALGQEEPIGWALGYLFGDVPRFRMEIVKANLQRWICLPTRGLESESCQRGWVEHLRHASFGAANTRLILFAYWFGVIIVGLAIVLRLSAVYEVDTRRKVFHFMMVAMLLPATYVDPTFAALALSLVLAVFLLLDLFRASQLPPLSKSLAYFLTPYVDGRDLKGPVVISHIFLLIGCAIPLWLSLGSLPRAGKGALVGWEVPTRELSMVSGVICVGLGDAAASLIGRRFGRRKWLWGGGKSIEGSVAFATAVCIALLLAKGWLRIGGWPANNADPWFMTAWKAVVAASVASLTEAVLTGGNDNVVVPIVLWLCVKGLDI
ncbi:phosphatidate cytidylyltransferase [Phlyctema vagabunda]|uniref:dolichol kinase n=1 Tax=Phlyctema vagabunda TaxID=108571 RepID=A0ABR4PYH5_9HELO